MLIKAPTTALKALLSGVPLSLVLGTNRSYLCSGVRIYDVPEAPVLVCNVQRHEEEHATLHRIAKDRKAPIFLFNELDVCVAWSYGNLNEHDSIRVLSFLTSYGEFYCGDFTPDASSVLDSFCFTIDPTQDVQGAKKIESIEIPFAHESWVSNSVSFIGVNDHQTVVLDDRDEGAVLERIVWASLESVFPLTLHKSPNITIGAKTRELTDVFAFYEHGCFLIEAKDLSILISGTHRKRERRAKGTQKQAASAIEQLVGAAKAVKRGEVVTDHNGRVLPLVIDQPLHCVVLLTELMHEGDWSEVEEALRKACLDSGDFFHVFDLRELITLLKFSRGSPHRFDYNLIERWKCFMKSGNVLIRSRIKP
ncbi:NERD domain-containing protein [Pseudomonas chlororaphis]|uniref:nuclease-related domain-containing protein n=1 Tax=Pseudomonas chlororaphis TaxID=587753 RepID=UPI001232C1B2|nr:nuclease-related domain-containing protein [Pseudomonas chlororaphis]KAA5847198.1 NERD domain-containing protein [Pseudomonas chlororaphis]